MKTWVLETVDYAPRRVLLGVVAVCVALLGYGMYLQHVVGLEPCPMCIVQRYAMVLIAVCALLSAGFQSTKASVVGAALVLLFALAGAFVAARQSWLQWYPPEVLSCGRDLYGMIENFPLRRVFPMVFRGGGDCSQVDWSLLGGSIANWSFLCFCGLGAVAALLIARQARLSKR